MPRLKKKEESKKEGENEKREQPKRQSKEKREIERVAEQEPKKKKVGGKAEQKRAPAKRAKSKDHPSYLKMISEAILEDAKRDGTSLILIQRYITENYKLELDGHVKSFIRLALRRGVENGDFLQVKHSYRLPSEARKLLRRRRPRKAHHKEGEKEREKSPRRERKEKKEKKEKEEEKEEEKPKKRKAKEPAKEKKGDAEKEEKPKKRKAEEHAKEKKADSDEEEKPKRKRAQKAKPEEEKKKKIEEEEPKKKRARKAKEGEEEKPKAKKPRAPKRGKKEAVVDKEIAIPEVLPHVVTSGVAFNTTDIPEVRMELKNTIESLMADDNIRVSIIANRGWKEHAQYNLEVIDFTDDSKAASDAVESAHGEGADWLSYYRQVLESALTLSWANHRNKVLILIGDQGVDAVRDASLQNQVGRLNTLGVKVYAFHHSQLVILQGVLSDLN